MPTFYRTADFKRDYRSLADGEKGLFKQAVEEFVEDLLEMEAGRLTMFRPSLRVKGVRNAEGILEMTWEYHDGRATFSYGDPIRPGVRHIIWRRIGGHEIFGRP